MLLTPSLLVFFFSLWGSMDLSLALKVTAPYEGFFWNKYEPLTVQWASVQTDPSNFGIQISNNDPNTYPVSTNRIVATGVSATAGHYIIQGDQGLKVGSGYQINLVSEENSGILAQSARFNISAGAANFSTGLSNTTPSVTTTSAKSSSSQALAGFPTQAAIACLLILSLLRCL